MNYMLKRRLRALFFPVRCPVCKKIIFPHEDFCGLCRENLPVYRGNFSIKDAEQFAAPFEYTEKIAPAIILMKDGIGGNAPYAFGLALAECLRKQHISEDVDIIIPAPLHPADEKLRGFNQSKLVANEVGRILNIDVMCKCVVKVRETEPQKLLNKKERLNNLKDAFDVMQADIIHKKRILLIDDVCTTGSTLAELTSLLLHNGAAKVYCGCCCKTPEIKSEVKENEV